MKCSEGRLTCTHTWKWSQELGKTLRANQDVGGGPDAGALPDDDDGDFQVRGRHRARQGKDMAATSAAEGAAGTSRGKRATQPPQKYREGGK